MSKKTERNQGIEKASACCRKRQGVALLAAGSLNPEEAENLKSHIDTCPACRQYWRELADVAAGLVNSPLQDGIEPSAAFHRNLMQRLRQEPARACWRSRVSEALATLFAYRWQTAAAALALIVVLVALFISFLPSSTGSASRKPLSYAGLTSAARPQSDSPPTLASYEAAASQSLDTLDAVLTRQANRPNPVLPTFRAWPFAVSFGE